MKKKLAILNNAVIINLLSAYLTVYALVNLQYIYNYSFFTLLIFIMLYFFYKKINIKTKINKGNKYLIIFSTIVSFMLTASKIVYTSIFVNYTNIIIEIFRMKNILLFASLFVLIFSLCTISEEMFFNIKEKNKKFNIKKLYFWSWGKDKNIKKKKYLIIFSTIVSSILIIGNIVNKNMLLSNVNIIKEIFTLKNILPFIGIFVLVLGVSLKIEEILSNIKKENKNFDNKKLFFWSFIIMFGVWSIYLLAFFPGVMSPDSFDQIKQVMDGCINNNHHPVFHTLFMAIPYKIGSLISGDQNIGIAFINICQMTILSLMFSCVITYLNKLKINKIFLIFVLLYYSVSPIFGFYSITLWKDILFGGFILLFSLTLYKSYLNLEILAIRNYFELFIFSLLCMLFRNNGIYVMIFLIPLALIITKKIKICIPLVISVIIYLIILGPVFNAIGVRKSRSAEYIGMPLQQIGRMVYKDLKFSKEESEYINQLMPINEIKVNYTPIVVDALKFNKNFNINVFDQNKVKFFIIWSKLVLKYPGTAIESSLASTLGYWYPNVKQEPLTVVAENKLGFENYYLFPKLRDKLSDFTYNGIPLFGLQWSIGTCMISILFLLMYQLHKKNKAFVLCSLPVVGVWLTLMIAAPVYAEFRYIFSAFCTLPLFIGLTIKSSQK